MPAKTNKPNNQTIKVYGYLRASTKEQNPERGKGALQTFSEQQGFTIKAFAKENESGSMLERPELMRLLRTARKGDVILVEQIDRLTRLHADDWILLKRELEDTGIRIVSLDCPTSWMFLTPSKALDGVMNAVNSMMMDMLATFARKDYEDRRRRQAEGIEVAKAAGKYRGKQVNPKTAAKCERAIELINNAKMTKEEAAKAAGVGVATLYRYIKQQD